MVNCSSFLVQGKKSSKGVKYEKPLPFLDDFCNKKEVFLNDDDCIKNKVLKSQS
jgi:hypothetical protein